MNENHLQADLNFLLQVLWTTAESNGNTRIIYPLLQANLELLDNNFAELLRSWTTDTLQRQEPEQYQLLISIVINFCNRIKDFPLGNQANNLEIAIAGYEVADGVLTREAFSQEWAAIQNNLGLVYSQRLLGKKAENLEKSITHLLAALEIYTHQAFPEQWAMTQNNLGNAYLERIQGEKAENFEAAIACYKAALEVYTCEAFPESWAMVQNNLGAVYDERIQGERGENLEAAIACYEAALKVYTRETFPFDWAMTQNNLGNAYLNRIQGKRAENLEAAIACYDAALGVRTRQEFPERWAQTQHNLGTAYLDRIWGERAENLETAITCCNNALEVRSREVFPYDWAMTQNNLGEVYRNRIKGERLENLEVAIQYYQAALEVYTHQALPYDWANTRNNLGLAYSERIQGSRAENLEMAIRCHKSALEIYTRQTFPEKWADTQNNLGVAYDERIQGERAENLEATIRYYKAALEVYSRSRFPEKWAMTHNNLGNVYRARILGETAENLELAIGYYEAALQVYTRPNFSEQWAMTKNNLANAYRDRIRGDKEENIELAIHCSLGILDVYTRQSFPQKWADTQSNLGISYCNRIRGNKSENLEVAINYLNAALEVYTSQAFPQKWADIQNNLGNVYRERIQGDKEENIELAIHCYEASLDVATHQAFPLDWAMTQNNLGNAYLFRIYGERKKNLEAAIQYYSSALAVYTYQAFPQHYADTQFKLGITYQKAQDFHKAYTAFATAINTIEFLRDEIILGSREDKQKLAEKWNDLYTCMVEICLEIGYLHQVIKYAEQSKSRNLVEMIFNRDSKTIFPSNIFTQLEQLRDEIAVGQYQIQNSTVQNPKLLAQHLQKLRQHRQELQDKYLPIGSGFRFDQFLSNLDNDTAIIEWYITNNRIFAFIIQQKLQTPVPTNGEEEITVWQSKPEDLAALVGWINEYLQSYDQQKDEWHNQLETRLKKLAEILHIEEILNRIPKHCDKLILIPHRYLHLFPLHALPIQESCLLELFPNGVSYAPSCQLLQLAQQRQREDFQSIFAIQNPTEDLLFTDLEINSILPLFSSHQVLTKTKATKTALSQAVLQLQEVNYLHFSCHGLFNPNSPLDSCLVLAGENEVKDLNSSEYLTLGNLFDQDLDLNKYRLVTLSACETGLIDSQNTSDEYIGLPSGFIYAGAKSVVSSLWTVNDFSTALLMVRFYQNIKTGLSISIALNQAQVWLRDITQDDLWMWVQQLNLDEDFKEQVYKWLSWFDANEVPFKKAIYWAAFCAIGE